MSIGYSVWKSLAMFPLTTIRLTNKYTAFNSESTGGLTFFSEPSNATYYMFY